MKCSALRILALTAALFLAVLTSSVLSADFSGQIEDIKSILAQISSEDPFERVLATKHALESGDNLLLSAGLEKALSSDDRRVRGMAYQYLVTKHKVFYVDVGIEEKDVEECMRKDKKIGARDDRSLHLYKANKLRLEIKDYNETNLNFNGNSNFDDFDGSIASGILLFRFNRYYAGCELELKQFGDGYLNGSLDCGPYSFAARAALP